MTEPSKRKVDPEAARQLVQARERAGLTQTEAAKRLGVHLGTLNRYEKGRMRIPADVLMKAEQLLTDPPKQVGRVREQLHLPSFWQGRMVGVRELLQNAMNAIQAADEEVRGLVDSEVLLGGHAPPPLTPEQAVSAVEASGLLDRPPPAAASDR